MRSFTLSREHELLLTAALGRGDRARAAYRQWAAALTFDRLDVASQRVLPLLVANESVTHDGAVRPDPVMARCVKVVRFTWLKTNLLLAQTAPVLGGFEQAGIPVLALKGSALLALGRARLSDRPMDDIDLAVPPDRLTEAFDVFIRLGFSGPLGVPAGRDLERWVRYEHALPFTNARGAEVDLHWHVLGQHRSQDADRAFWAAARPGSLGGAACSATAPEHTIVAVVGHAMGGPAATLRWATDIALLARSQADDGIDWDEVARLSRRLHIDLAVGTALDAVARLAQIDVPATLRRPARRWAVGQRLELATARRDAPASRASVLALAYMEHVRQSEPAARRSAPATLARFLAAWWALPGARSLPRYMARRAGLGRGRRDGEGVGPELHDAPRAGLEPGRQVSCAMGGDGSEFLGRGWAQPETHGTWSIGRAATLGVTLPWLAEDDRAVALELAVTPFLPARRPTLTVRVEAGGREVARWFFNERAWRLERRVVELPRALVPGGQLRVRLVFDYPVSPDAAAAPSGGSQPISLAIHSLRVDRR